MSALAGSFRTAEEVSRWLAVCSVWQGDIAQIPAPVRLLALSMADLDTRLRPLELLAHESALRSINAAVLRQQFPATGIDDWRWALRTLQQLSSAFTVLHRSACQTAAGRRQLFLTHVLHLVGDTVTDAKVLFDDTLGLDSAAASSIRMSPERVRLPDWFWDSLLQGELPHPSIRAVAEPFHSNGGIVATSVFKDSDDSRGLVADGSLSASTITEPHWVMA